MKMIQDLKEYQGFSRKAHIRELVRIVAPQCNFDDAGWFDIGDLKIVVSTDGIAEELTAVDPWSAGYFSVLVNVNDIVAKGARPIGYTGVVSSSSRKIRIQIVKGVKAALRKYELRILKFHTNPSSTYNSIDAAVIGVAKNVIPSSTAIPGDDVIVALDLDGLCMEKGWVKYFESSRKKSSGEVKKKIDAMITIAEKQLATASRDISAPGIVGTIAMLCESSCVGAVIDLEKIPKPKNVDMDIWLRSYPSFGFIVATSSPKECCDIFAKYGYRADVVGELTNDDKLTVKFKGEAAVFLDFKRESVFGMKR
jgi:selenophosphate synthetase-related protein